MDDEKLNDSIPDSVVIKYLIRDNRAILQEMGKDRAYISELEDLLKSEKNKSAELRDLSNEMRKEVKKETLYKSIKSTLESCKSDNKILRRTRDELLSKINKYEKILKENNLL